MKVAGSGLTTCLPAWPAGQERERELSSAEEAASSLQAEVTHLKNRLGQMENTIKVGQGG